MLTRDQILALDDLPRKAVDVPEWDTTVYVRKFSGRDRFELERLITEASTSEADALGALVALCLVDEKGTRLFSSEDVELLQAKNANALTTIAKAAIAFNTLTDEAVADAGNG